jgi:YHS domain-containing protein
MKHILIAGLLALVLAACHSSPTSEPVAAPAIAKDTVKTYDAAILDSKKDPVCGMPSGSGMEDTIHLGGKVIGFCSKECKAAFLKSPKSYAIQYK